MTARKGGFCLFAICVMINFLCGKVELTESAPGALSILIESGPYSVGYRVVCCDRDRNYLGSIEGNMAHLYVRVLKKEESELFLGFRSQIDRINFDKLIQIQGIGPSTALKMIDMFPELELRNASEKDLVKTPGVGPKTAKKIKEFLS